MERPKAPELIVSVLAAALLVGSVAGLTRSRDGGQAPDAVAGGPSAVEIIDFSFGPKDVSVAVGDTITWTNADSATHTVTGKEGETLKSPDLKTDDTYEVTLEAPGTFEYVCKFHPNMQGTITVEG